MNVSVRSYFTAATICSTPWTVSASKLAGQDARFHNAPTSSNQLTGSESERVQNNASHNTKSAAK